MLKKTGTRLYRPPRHRPGTGVFPCPGVGTRALASMLIHGEQHPPTPPLREKIHRPGDVAQTASGQALVGRYGLYSLRGRGTWKDRPQGGAAAGQGSRAGRHGLPLVWIPHVAHRRARLLRQQYVHPGTVSVMRVPDGLLEMAIGSALVAARTLVRVRDHECAGPSIMSGHESA